MNNKKIYIASDHAGFELKDKLIGYLATAGYTVQDMGPEVYDPTDDYPDFVSLAAREVSKDPENALGVVIGGSGQGEAVVANRFPHVRAGVYYGGSLEVVRLMRLHNDSNILSLGARFVSTDDAITALRVWLTTPFSGEERHSRRHNKIEALNIPK